ncbi:MAG: bifunctional phosphoribosylaminoimidazolecarboxamide formyltransferase/IMP cyclohydrolase [bacterium]|nr:bifunctional phosphoribosylaminoimidazolecarboxamide formyltransferase/IMP cyclohydrolase [bacterium]
MEKAALISVTDKKGVIEFARSLTLLGYKILSSSGTATALREAGVSVILVEDYTGQKEILDGRVKTLHPKIHAGILAKRSDLKHMQELKQDQILPIDLVVVNLYPFLEKLNSAERHNPSSMVNFIDIGGPAMLRAASKNHEGVLPVIDPSDYDKIIAALQSGSVSLNLRRELASKVFTTLANYDLQIGKYYAGVAASGESREEDLILGPVSGLVLVREQELRYGENPHQKAHLYRDMNASPGHLSWKQLQGKALSYNNLLDFDACLRLIRDIGDRPAATIFKHLNPCGVGRGVTLLQALQRAKKGDPRSHFGGVVGFNMEVTSEVAEELTEGFVEIILAPKFDSAAMSVLSKRKNLRVLEIDLKSHSPQLEMRIIQDGILVQERDKAVSDVRKARLVSKRKPTEAEYNALQFTWAVCSHVKSNAVVAGNEDLILAIGAGQMSRVDSAELLINRAKLHDNDITNAVVASDAFFPFPDSVEHLIKAGVAFIVAPGGASRDSEIIAAVDKLGGGLLFVEDRHFRH